MKNFLLVSLVLCSFSLNSIVLAQPVSISGTIEGIKALNDGRFELTVKTDEGSSVFFISNQTLIKESLPAHQIKKGQTILLSSGGVHSVVGFKGVKGMHSPFGNNSAKTLGLPDLPNIPEVPSVPQIPQVPNIPKIPQIPNIAQNPAGSGSPKKGSESKEGELNDISKLPPDASFTQLNPSPVSASTDSVNSSEKVTDVPAKMVDVPKKVVALKETKEGIKLKLEGEKGQEDILLSPNEIVFQSISVKDLHKNMKVQLDADGENVQQITIA